MSPGSLAAAALQTSAPTFDYETLIVAAAAGFFVLIALVLLARYRSASARISDSTDLGKDLWNTMESRLKKQDERIVDVMARLEVLQARAMESEAGPKRPMPRFTPTQPPAQVTRPLQQASQMSQAPARQQAPPDATELQVIRLLSERPRTSVEIRDLTGKTREHAARLMKDLYDRGLVVRNAQNKPYVYQLSDAGRHYLTTG